MQLIVTGATMYCSDAGELAKVVKALEVEQCFGTLSLAHDRTAQRPLDARRTSQSPQTVWRRETPCKQAPNGSAHERAPLHAAGPWAQKLKS